MGWEGEIQGQTVQLNEQHLFLHSSFNLLLILLHPLKCAFLELEHHALSIYEPCKKDGLLMFACIVHILYSHEMRDFSATQASMLPKTCRQGYDKRSWSVVTKPKHLCNELRNSLRSLNLTFILGIF